MIDPLPLGEIDRQHAPLDAPLRHIKDGIEHRSHTQGARSSTAFGGGDQIFDPLPFLVSQVAWIDCFVHLPIVPTCKDFSDRLLDIDTFISVRSVWSFCSSSAMPATSHGALVCA